MRPEPFGVHRPGPGCEDHAHSLGGGYSKVPLKVPRIGPKILSRAELCRVHEDAQDYDGAGPLCYPYELDMPPVQKAHRGHEHNRLAPGPRPFGEGPHLLDAFDYLHFYWGELSEESSPQTPFKDF